MMLAGSVQWECSASPLLSLAPVVVLGRPGRGATPRSGGSRIPTAIVASGLTVAAFTADAALGGPMQPGSLLNSRPIFGLRWYGFGNATFAAYATTGLLLAGYVAHRLIAGGRRQAALAVVAAIGFGMVICEGWPSMGTDFGGVIALTPPVLWLVLVLSGIRITRLRLIAGWRGRPRDRADLRPRLGRGPDRRSHLGNFVQRIIDGDALDVVARKAVASWATIANPWGSSRSFSASPYGSWPSGSWGPQARDEFSTLGPVVHAVMAMGVLEHGAGR